jgi:hypothetical protein
MMMIIIFWEITPCGSYKNLMIIIFWEMTPCGSYKNLMIIIFWEMTPCGSYKNLMIIIFWEMMPCGSYKNHLPEDDNHHNHRRGNLKSYDVNDVYCPSVQPQAEKYVPRKL